MNLLINIERQKIEQQLKNGLFDQPMILGIRFYSDKLVIERKQSSNKTIRAILLELANEDSQSV